MEGLIQPNSRVRVRVERGGFHLRNFNATVINWTKDGLIKVLEDGKDYPRNYSSENVRLIK